MGKIKQQLIDAEESAPFMCRDDFVAKFGNDYIDVFENYWTPLTVEDRKRGLKWDKVVIPLRTITQVFTGLGHKLEKERKILWKITENHPSGIII